MTTKIDRRAKLTDDQRDQIRQLHQHGASANSLAKRFGVSRRLVGFIVEPLKLAENREQQKPKRCTWVSNSKMYRREYMRQWRAGSERAGGSTKTQ